MNNKPHLNVQLFGGIKQTWNAYGFIENQHLQILDLYKCHVFTYVWYCCYHYPGLGGPLIVLAMWSVKQNTLGVKLLFSLWQYEWDDLFIV